MSFTRIQSHPVLEIPSRENIEFSWQNKNLIARAGETIASALIANGVDIFGHHPRDNAPLGLFCANGQCSQCLVLVSGKPMKACMTEVKAGMNIMPADGLPDVSGLSSPNLTVDEDNLPEPVHVPVLIIGGGPAGLSAAIELGKMGIQTLLIDDKSELGGKLVLQTHRFFGSSDAVYAGVRGTEIAQILAEKISSQATIEVWLQTTAVGVFEDGIVGVWRSMDDSYILIKPETLLVATGARERSLAFKGNTLPGIFGAGAFQTLVNRDLIKPADNLFIIGGGNVGLIAGYHALQAGINVVGLVEAMPACGGYKVHEDKLARLGVPIHTSHTILEAYGEDHVHGVRIAALNAAFEVIPDAEKEFACDCVLIAVGLSPVDEFIRKAEAVGLPVFAAGDAAEIAEASAAIFSGRIKSFEIAQHLGHDNLEIPADWFTFEDTLKSRPGSVLSIQDTTPTHGVFPVLHCRQEIPCDPCSTVCPNHLILIDPSNIRQIPTFCPTDEKICIGCERCVAVCPGLAISLVDFRRDPDNPIVSLPLEFSIEAIHQGDLIAVTDVDGKVLGHFPVISIRMLRQFSKTRIIRVQLPSEFAHQAAGLQPHRLDVCTPEMADRYLISTDQPNIVCRCEHISAEEIRSLIRNGVRDINQIKAVTKATMGACGGKTCLEIIKKLFREEGVPMDDVTDTTQRPVFVELPLETLIKNQRED